MAIAAFITFVRLGGSYNSTVEKLPHAVILTLTYLLTEFRSETYMVSARRPAVFTGEQFRTAARCTDDDSVVLGGWEMATGRWFQLTLSESDAHACLHLARGHSGHRHRQSC